MILYRSGEQGELHAESGDAPIGRLPRAGLVVRENFGAIEAFEKAPNGVRMVFRKHGDWKPPADARVRM